MDARKLCIGVFDSGFGGLTVLRSLLEILPHCDFLYFGDTARLPYGSKSAETVAKYALDAVDYIQHQGADFLVIACNTATALALDRIEQASSIPVLGVIEPGAQAAAEASREQRVVVLATEATVASHAYRRALERRGVRAKEKACPLLVPLVEEGWTDHSVTAQVARIYVEDAISDDFHSADVLVLGCTHYPLIRSLLKQAAPSAVSIVDSAESTAHAVAGLQPILSSRALVREGAEPPRLRFFVTDSAEKFCRLGARFLGRSIEEVHHVDLKE
jgi:glutamate racemase